MAFNLLNRMMLNWHMKSVSFHSLLWFTMKLAFQLCMMVSEIHLYLTFIFNRIYSFNFPICLGNLKNEKRVLQWLIDQKSKTVPFCLTTNQLYSS